MGRAIDLFVTYRFIKLLVTPFEKTEAYKLGIIDKNGNILTKTSNYGTLGDVLTAEGIAMTEASIDIYDVNGQDKPARPGTALAQGDTVQIVRKSNKSGIAA